MSATTEPTYPIDDESEVQLLPLETRREITAKWLARLRDPESKQVREKLANPNDDSYCCLGHLCVVMGLDMSFGYFNRLGLELELLPSEVCAKMGFKQDPSVNKSLSITASLTELNDELLFSLPRIADVIENNLVDGILPSSPT